MKIWFLSPVSEWLATLPDVFETMSTLLAGHTHPLCQMSLNFETMSTLTTEPTHPHKIDIFLKGWYFLAAPLDQVGGGGCHLRIRETFLHFLINDNDHIARSKSWCEGSFAFLRCFYSINIFTHLSQSLARVDREGEEDDEEESLYQATKF